MTNPYINPHEDGTLCYAGLKRRPGWYTISHLVPPPSCLRELYVLLTSLCFREDVWALSDISVDNALSIYPCPWENTYAVYDVGGRADVVVVEADERGAIQRS